jgi:hypothetical protein
MEPYPLHTKPTLLPRARSTVSQLVLCVQLCSVPSCPFNFRIYFVLPIRSDVLSIISDDDFVPGVQKG